MHTEHIGNVKVLTQKMRKMSVKPKFNRAAYRKLYDSKYFRKKVRCPNCGQLKVKHMLRRHMQTKKCQRLAERLAVGA